MNNLKHIVLYSGGLGSYYTTKRLLENGIKKEDITLLFTDTKIEDEDLYRFLKESTEKLEIPLTNCSDGRDIWEVFKDVRFLGNSRLDPCSRVLKREMSRKYIKQFDPSEVIVYLGYDWTEVHRYEKAQKAWLPYVLKCPLIDPPFLDKEDMKRKIEEVDGIRLPRLYKMGFAHNNCFSGDTRYITEYGIKDFESTVGTKQMVLSEGNFIEANIESFGEQKLYQLTLSQNLNEKDIFVTSDHRWILYGSERGNTRIEKLTSELRIGDSIVSQYGTGVSGVRPSSFGISHGIVFGDGTMNTAKNSFAFIELCGNKNVELTKWFPLSPQLKTKNGIKISDLPRFYKKLPSMEESKSYLLGWLMGYFAADGTVKKDGIASMSSSKKENLLFVKDLCCKLSIGTSPIKVEIRIGIDKKLSNIYTMYFVRKTLSEDFFLIDDHKSRFVENVLSNNRNPSWKVVSIKETDRIEKVYCAVVPKTHSFVLEDNVLTGNCGGGCVKAGIGHFKLLYNSFPERYKEWEDNEEKIRQHLDKDVSILRRTRNGERKNITLAELRKEFDSFTEEENCDIGGCGCFEIKDDELENE